MTLTTADRDALRAYLATEFHRWVENLLSRDELPLVGSAVPATTQTPHRRGNPKNKTKTKTKAQKKTSREEDKAPREEDKTSAPAAPAREDQVPAPAASSPEDAGDWKTPSKAKRRRSPDSSPATKPGKRPRAVPPTSSSSTTQCHTCQGFGHPTHGCKRTPVCAQCSGSHRSIVCVEKRVEGIPPTYHCDLCNEDGHGRRSRFCRSRPQPTKPKRKDPQDDAMDTAPPAPTTSVATTQTARATCTIGTQVDIPLMADLTEWRPSHSRDVKIRQQDWLDSANLEDITGRQDSEGHLVDLQVNIPFPAANEVLARQLAKSGISGHDCKDAQCLSATKHLISVPISKALRVYARALDTDIELQTSSTSQVFLKSIAGRRTQDSDKLRLFIPKISPPLIDPFAEHFARLGVPKIV